MNAVGEASASGAAGLLTAAFRVTLANLATTGYPRDVCRRSLTLKAFYSCVAALLLAGVAVPASAAGELPDTRTPLGTPVRALLWLQPETDELLDRIRGQTNDLAAELLVDAFEPMPGDLGAQLRIAHSLSARQSATVVIWFVKQMAGERHFTVNIALPNTHRLLTRDLGPYGSESDGTRLSSAVKETAALVVRAAIQAVLSGSIAGEQDVGGFREVTESQATEIARPAAQAAGSEQSAEPEGETAQPSRATTSARATSTAERQEQSENANSRRWPWAIAAEWLVLYDGAQNEPFAQCALLRAERSVQWLRAFALASGCLNREIDRDNYGRFRIGRQGAAVGANAILWQAGFEASLGAQVGALVYRRTTLPAPGAASPKTHVMGAIGPEFRLLVPARGSRLQAGLVVGLDFVTSSLTIGYADSGATAVNHFTPITKIGPVQPYVTLGLTFRL